MLNKKRKDMLTDMAIELANDLLREMYYYGQWDGYFDECDEDCITEEDLDWLRKNVKFEIKTIRNKND